MEAGGREGERDRGSKQNKNEFKDKSELALVSFHSEGPRFGDDQRARKSIVQRPVVSNSLRLGMDQLCGTANGVLFCIGRPSG